MVFDPLCCCLTVYRRYCIARWRHKRSHFKTVDRKKHSFNEFLIPFQSQWSVPCWRLPLCPVLIMSWNPCLWCSWFFCKDIIFIISLLLILYGALMCHLIYAIFSYWFLQYLVINFVWLLKEWNFIWSHSLIWCTLWALLSVGICYPA